MGLPGIPATDRRDRVVLGVHGGRPGTGLAPGTFCDGTRWVVGHRFSGYDGRDHFVAAGGPQSVTRTASGETWAENWDAEWRPSHPGCSAVDRTREIARDYIATLAGELGWT